MTTTMAASDVTATLKDALEVTGLTEARVHHKPLLLSDNGPCHISKELREWLQDPEMKHTRGARYHPMTQGKIERYHRSMKYVVKLENYYFPWELENAIAERVVYCALDAQGRKGPVKISPTPNVITNLTLVKQPILSGNLPSGQHRHPAA